MVDEWFSSAFDAHLLNSDCDFYELNHVNDFNQMMDLTGEEEKDGPICSFDQNCNEELTLHDRTTSTINTFGPTLDDIFDFNSAGTCDLDLVLEASTDERNKELPTKKVGDRSRSLISERRRRRRMKEKLYALRALVPEITKMDKASIVADAASYVQNLQKKVKELESEISEIETFVRGTGVSENSNFTQITCSKILNRMKICQMDIFQVETREFYVRLVCEKGGGVAIALYKAIESLTFFDLRNSNFNTDAERLVFSFTLQITKCEDEVSPRMMKSWIVGALQNQGFDLQRILSL